MLFKDCAPLDAQRINGEPMLDVIPPKRFAHGLSLSAFGLLFIAAAWHSSFGACQTLDPPIVAGEVWQGQGDDGSTFVISMFEGGEVELIWDGDTGRVVSWMKITSFANDAITLIDVDTNDTSVAVLQLKSTTPIFCHDVRFELRRTNDHRWTGSWASTHCAKVGHVVFERRDDV